MAPIDPLISAQWLADNIDKSDVKTLDGTWVMPGENPDLPQGFIPDAQIFDIDEIAAPHLTLKHMLPSAEKFSTAMSVMGISPADHVVIYDRHGIRTAPRLWWTLRMFGHERVSILDGGLPAWLAAGQSVNDAPQEPNAQTKYKISPPLSGVVSQDDVLKTLGQIQILDARSRERFSGAAPEPRAGLRSGHIPGSFSLPYTEMWTADRHFKSLSNLAEEVGKSGIDLNKPIITTCGSGVTAAGLAFTLHRLGAKDVSLYDGSWSEWGASSAPIEKG